MRVGLPTMSAEKYGPDLSRRPYGQRVVIASSSNRAASANNITTHDVWSRTDETGTGVFPCYRGGMAVDGDAEVGAELDAHSATVRIVLADDHTIVRTGLRMLLDAERDFEIVAEAGDVESARRYVRGHHPAVLILDLNMPGGSSLEAIPLIRAEAPGTHIVVLTMQEEPAFARGALAAGATGYVLKKAADGELVEAVRRAAAGEAYLNPTLAAQIAREVPKVPADDLSEREVQVLRLIALGHTNGEIAEKLFLSVRTVETHRAHIQQKLLVSSRAQLVAYALQRGLVTSE
jgi:two-component system response regulator NreC